jgi:hypothetical protein
VPDDEVAPITAIYVIAIGPLDSTRNRTILCFRRTPSFADRDLGAYGIVSDSVITTIKADGLH